MATKRLSRPERRASILATATDLFRRFGFGATTTAMLSEAEGVTEPILYRHFDGKEAMFAECIREAEKPATVKTKEINALLHLITVAGDAPNLSLIMQGITESGNSVLIRNATRDAILRWKEESGKRSR